MTDQTSPEGRGAEPIRDGSASRWSILVPAAALLVGLVIGGAVVGVAVGGDDDDAASTSPQPTPSSSGQDAADPSAAATVVVVPDECLDAVSTVEEVTRVLREGASAVSDFRTDELRSLLRELEALDLQARDQVDACRDVRTEASAAAE